jgi:hypothetical protein
MTNPEPTMPTATEKKTAALLRAALRKLPARRRCPRCGKLKGKAAFGLRVMERDKAGLPVRIRVQSYCGPCRSSKG